MYLVFSVFTAKLVFLQTDSLHLKFVMIKENLESQNNKVNELIEQKDTTYLGKAWRPLWSIKRLDEKGKKELSASIGCFLHL